jgi:hypothetical protein
MKHKTAARLDSMEQKKSKYSQVLSAVHEQLIPNTIRFKPAFAKKDKRQVIIDFREIPTNWFKQDLQIRALLFRLLKRVVFLFSVFDCSLTRQFVSESLAKVSLVVKMKICHLIKFCLKLLKTFTMHM